MNNHNKYPIGWHGRKPNNSTVSKWRRQREACEKIKKYLYPPQRLFFNGLLPIKPHKLNNPCMLATWKALSASIRKGGNCDCGRCPIIRTVEGNWTCSNLACRKVHKR